MIIPATEAKKKTNGAKVEIVINDKITKAANNGFFSVEFGEYELDKDFIDKLTKLGYKVKENLGGGSAYEDPCLDSYTVYWS